MEDAIGSFKLQYSVIIKLLNNCDKDNNKAIINKELVRIRHYSMITVSSYMTKLNSVCTDPFIV